MADIRHCTLVGIALDGIVSPPDIPLILAIGSSTYESKELNLPFCTKFKITTTHRYNLKPVLRELLSHYINHQHSQISLQRPYFLPISITAILQANIIRSFCPFYQNI